VKGHTAVANTIRGSHSRMRLLEAIDKGSTLAIRPCTPIVVVTRSESTIESRDLDSTKFAINDHEGRFIRGFYDHHMRARFRQSHIDGSAGSLDEVKRIVGQIRQS
jgi:hypothetical protein